MEKANGMYNVHMCAYAHVCKFSEPLKLSEKKNLSEKKKSVNPTSCSQVIGLIKMFRFLSVDICNIFCVVCVTLCVYSGEGGRKC